MDKWTVSKDKDWNFIQSVVFKSILDIDKGYYEC